MDMLNATLSHLYPILMIVTMMVTNQVLNVKRTEKKNAQEARRLRAALSAELRSVANIYRTNLDLLEQNADYLLSTRYSTVIYRGSIARLPAALDDLSIARVVAFFAENEQIEAMVAAHSNLSCSLTYRITNRGIEAAKLTSLYARAMPQLQELVAYFDGYEARTPKLSIVSPWRVLASAPQPLLAADSLPGHPIEKLQAH